MRYLRFLAVNLARMVVPAALLATTRLVGQAPAEGIRVTGHWVVEVRDADGTLQHRREFKNSLQAQGKRDLVGLLSRGLTIQRWQVVASASTQPGPCSIHVAWCVIVEPSDTRTGTFKNLTVTPSDVELVLQGSFVAVNDSHVQKVETGIERIIGGNSFVPDNFTVATLAAAIPVKATQSVSVTVTFGFE